MPPDFTGSYDTMAISSDMMMQQQSAQNGPLWLFILVIQIALFLFMAYSQYTLSQKMNIKYSWMAWIPVLSGINLVWIAGKSLSKYISLAVLFIVCLVASPFLVMVIWPVALALSFIWGFGLLGLSLAILDGVSRRTGHGFLWAVGLLLLYPIMFPITAFGYKPMNTVPTNTPPAIW